MKILIAPDMLMGSGYRIAVVLFELRDPELLRHTDLLFLLCSACYSPYVLSGN